MTLKEFFRILLKIQNEEEKKNGEDGF